MPTRARSIALWLLSVTVGAVFGYLLFNPLFTLPVEAVAAGLKPAFQFSSASFESRYTEHIFQVVSVVFIMNLPNTILVSVVTALCLSWLQRRRQILYATLLWPLFLHLAYWLQVSLMKLGALQLGLPDTERLPVPQEFRYNSVLILITVTVFLFVVLLFDWWLNKGRHNPPLNTDAPTSGAPVS